MLRHEIKETKNDDQRYMLLNPQDQTLHAQDTAEYGRTYIVFDTHTQEPVEQAYYFSGLIMDSPPDNRTLSEAIGDYARSAEAGAYGMLSGVNYLMQNEEGQEWADDKAAEAMGGTSEYFKARTYPGTGFNATDLASGMAQGLPSIAASVVPGGAASLGVRAVGYGAQTAGKVGGAVAGATNAAMVAGEAGKFAEEGGGSETAGVIGGALVGGATGKIGFDRVIRGGIGRVAGIAGAGAAEGLAEGIEVTATHLLNAMTGGSINEKEYLRELGLSVAAGGGLGSGMRGMADLTGMIKAINKPDINPIGVAAAVAGDVRDSEELGDAVAAEEARRIFKNSRHQKAFLTLLYMKNPESISVEEFQELFGQPYEETVAQAIFAAVKKLKKAINPDSIRNARAAAMASMKEPKTQEQVLQEMQELGLDPKDQADIAFYEKYSKSEAMDSYDVMFYKMKKQAAAEKINIEKQISEKEKEKEGEKALAGETEGLPDEIVSEIEAAEGSPLDKAKALQNDKKIAQRIQKLPVLLREEAQQAVIEKGEQELEEYENMPIPAKERKALLESLEKDPPTPAEKAAIDALVKKRGEFNKAIRTEAKLVSWGVKGVEGAIESIQMGDKTLDDYRPGQKIREKLKEVGYEGDIEKAVESVMSGETSVKKLSEGKTPAEIAKEKEKQQQAAGEVAAQQEVKQVKEEKLEQQKPQESVSQETYGKPLEEVIPKEQWEDIYENYVADPVEERNLWHESGIFVGTGKEIMEEMTRFANKRKIPRDEIIEIARGFMEKAGNYKAKEVAGEGDFYIIPDFTKFFLSYISEKEAAESNTGDLFMQKEPKAAEPAKVEPAKEPAPKKEEKGNYKVLIADRKIGGASNPVGTANVIEIPLKDINIDAKTFQHRIGGNESGKVETLDRVQQWDDSRSQQIMVFTDKEGNSFVVDGHQRVNLARRLDEKGRGPEVMIAEQFKESDGWTKESAMAYAAHYNLSKSDNRKEAAWEAAKLLKLSRGNTKQARQVRKVLETLEENKVGAESNQMKVGAKLSRLEDSAFDLAMQVDFRPHLNSTYIAMIPEYTEDTNWQQHIIAAMREYKDDITSERSARNFIAAKVEAFKVKAPAKIETENLFGSDFGSAYDAEKIKSDLVTEIQAIAARDRRTSSIMEQNAETYKKNAFIDGWDKDKTSRMKTFATLIDYWAGKRAFNSGYFIGDKIRKGVEELAKIANDKNFMKSEQAKPKVKEYGKNIYNELLSGAEKVYVKAEKERKGSGANAVEKLLAGDTTNEPAVSTEEKDDMPNNTAGLFSMREDTERVKVKGGNPIRTIQPIAPLLKKQPNQKYPKKYWQQLAAAQGKKIADLDQEFLEDRYSQEIYDMKDMSEKQKKDYIKRRAEYYVKELGSSYDKKELEKLKQDRINLLHKVKNAKVKKELTPSQIKTKEKEREIAALYAGIIEQVADKLDDKGKVEVKEFAKMLERTLPTYVMSEEWRDASSRVKISWSKDVSEDSEVIGLVGMHGEGTGWSYDIFTERTHGSTVYALVQDVEGKEGKVAVTGNLQGVFNPETRSSAVTPEDRGIEAHARGGMANMITELLREIRAKGYEYLGVTDAITMSRVQGYMPPADIEADWNDEADWDDENWVRQYHPEFYFMHQPIEMFYEDPFNQNQQVMNIEEMTDEDNERTMRAVLRRDMEEISEFNYKEYTDKYIHFMNDGFLVRDSLDADSYIEFIKENLGYSQEKINEIEKSLKSEKDGGTGNHNPEPILKDAVNKLEWSEFKRFLEELIWLLRDANAGEYEYIDMEDTFFMWDPVHEEIRYYPTEDDITGDGNMTIPEHVWNLYNEVLPKLMKNKLPKKSGVKFVPAGSKDAPAQPDEVGLIGWLDLRGMDNDEEQVMFSAKEDSQTKTPQFKKWFGNSVVKDKDGEPLVVYHGTKNEFNAFDFRKIGEQGSDHGYGFYFTDDYKLAQGYTGDSNKRGPVLATYLSISKPASTEKVTIKRPLLRKLVSALHYEGEKEGEYYGFAHNYGDGIETNEQVINKVVDIYLEGNDNDVDIFAELANDNGGAYERVSRAIKEITGYDGIVSQAGEAKIYVTFTPEQIKSATDNTGDFDPNNDDIRFSAKEGEEQTGTPAFKKWFGDWEKDPENASKVVDENGKPRVVYHGTDRNFNKFNPKKSAMAGIFWFTSSKAAVENQEVGAAGKGKIKELYLDIKNPAGWEQYEKRGIGELIAFGYDGVILPNGHAGETTYIAFYPNQMKSATKNSGDFDPDNNDIRFSAQEAIYNQAEYMLNSLRGDKASMREAIDNFAYGEASKEMARMAIEALPNGVQLGATAVEMLTKIAQQQQSLQNASETLKQRVQEVTGLTDLELLVKPLEEGVAGTHVVKNGRSTIEIAADLSDNIKNAKAMHEAIHAIYINDGGSLREKAKPYVKRWMKNQRVARMVEKSLAMHESHRQKKGLKPLTEAQRQRIIEEEAMAYAFEFWMEGGTVANGGIFGKLKKLLEELVAFVRGDLRLMNAIKKGKYAVNKSNVSTPGAKKFSIMGRKSATYDKGNEKAAAKMEAAGASKQEIWDKTGTFRDAHGNWAQETKEPTIEPKAGSMIEKTLRTGKPVKLSSLYANNPVFKAYPQLRDIGVMATMEDVAGLYRPEDNEIHIGKIAYDADENILEQVFEHEIQHAVDVIEKKPPGTSPSTELLNQAQTVETWLNAIDLVNREMMPIYKSGDQTKAMNTSTAMNYIYDVTEEAFNKEEWASNPLRYITKIVSQAKKMYKVPENIAMRIYKTAMILAYESQPGELQAIGTEVREPSEYPKFNNPVAKEANYQTISNVEGIAQKIREKIQKETGTGHTKKSKEIAKSEWEQTGILVSRRAEHRFVVPPMQLIPKTKRTGKEKKLSDIVKNSSWIDKIGINPKLTDLKLSGTQSQQKVKIMNFYANEIYGAGEYTAKDLNTTNLFNRYYEDKK